jgi:hypothetical protein
MEDYFFYVGSSKQASDYETTAKFLINYIQRTFNDGCNVAVSLQKLQEIDMDEWAPPLKVSNAADETTRATKNCQYDVLYNAKVDAMIQRKKNYQNNLYKAYALLWERCAKAMQS